MPCPEKRVYIILGITLASKFRRIMKIVHKAHKRKRKRAETRK